MRQRVAAERSTSTRSKDDVNRFTVAAHQFGKLNLHTQELAKTIRGLAGNIRTAAASCQPTPIPSLFAEVTPHASPHGYQSFLASRMLLPTKIADLQSRSRRNPMAVIILV